jgi:hypothetical protein
MIDQIANLDDVVKSKFQNQKISAVFDSTSQSPYFQ